MKNYIDSYGTADAIAYFSGSDRGAEYYDTLAPLFGGTGLITRDAVFKPAAFALQFLNRLYKYYIDRGEQYIITTDGHGNYAMLCHNCKNLNYNYYYIEEDQVEKEHLAKYFDDNEPVSLRFLLNGVEDGDYHVKKYRVNKRNGSILDLWQETDYETELSRNDISYFRRVCAPKMQIQTVTSDQHSLPIDVSMMSNEIMLVRILKNI